MLNFFNKNKKNRIISPQTGKIVSLIQVPDDVFSEKILGDGVAIIPQNDDILSPVNGIIMQIASTSHAYGIRSDDGLDILMHVGVDTVSLKGAGFKTLVKKGKRVRSGDLIAKADIKLIKNRGLYTHTSILITNMNKIKSFECAQGDALAGKTEIISYIIQN